MKVLKIYQIEKLKKVKKKGDLELLRKDQNQKIKLKIQHSN